MKKFSLLILLLALSAVLAACNTTIEEQRDKTLEEVEAVFNADPERANEEGQDLEFHIPYFSEVAEEADHNIVIEKSNETYVLFHHLNEEAGQDAIYTMTEASSEEWLVNETFEANDQFGYVLLRQIDEEEYELVTGVNHVKVTTVTDLQNIADNAEWMMETARSAQWK
ncbi:hypothetical protein [Jeotgalibacillus sp. R-1-5s-1]|uniref:hypothetical protein n=1 Tax=Jeotgalibacillus sp. R-1-5s-1 TaxID=2555897 RepID=UPI00106970F9|nr:hypothetical protein [Jeotgalibacillus sp. R-1-5s-1]TFD98186.1 hypothetical protein E2491_08755 [Jeotgalibacillus sp. R-1-5s-1]